MAPEPAGRNWGSIRQITLIAAWFNYVNRVADALIEPQGTPNTGNPATAAERAII